MAFDAKTERLLSLKKLSGKAHTSNIKGISNEELPSGVTVAAASVFGQAIPVSPSAGSLYAISNSVVEFVRLSASFVNGSDTTAGQHALAWLYQMTMCQILLTLKKGQAFILTKAL